MIYSWKIVPNPSPESRDPSPIAHPCFSNNDKNAQSLIRLSFLKKFKIYIPGIALISGNKNNEYFIFGIFQIFSLMNFVTVDSVETPTESINNA